MTYLETGDFDESIAALLTEMERREVTAGMDQHARPAGNAAESFGRIDLAAVLSGNLAQPVPTMLIRRGDGLESALFYPGAVNGLHGDSGSGKSWAAVLLLAERIRAGENVMLLDLEDTPHSIVGRLTQTGVEADSILARLDYRRPTEPFGPIEVAHLVDAIQRNRITVVVIDSLGEAFGVEGLNEDRDNEVGPWLRAVARVLADAGPAVVLIDHSTKAGEQNLHPSGSKRKRAAIGGASYLAEVVTPFSKDHSGRLRLICAKDRHGTYRRSEHVAWLDMEPHPDGTVTLELIAPAPAGPVESKNETVARCILGVLEREGTAVAKGPLRSLCRADGLRASNQAIDDGVELLAHNGPVVEEAGPRNARLFRLPDDQNPK